MKRLFYVAAGAAAGVVVARKASRAAARLTPAGMTNSLAASIENLGDAIREFGWDVREAMWDREEALRDALGLESDLDTVDDVKK